MQANLGSVTTCNCALAFSGFSKDSQDTTKLFCSLSFLRLSSPLWCSLPQPSVSSSWRCTLCRRQGWFLQYTGWNNGQPNVLGIIGNAPLYTSNPPRVKAQQKRKWILTFIGRKRHIQSLTVGGWTEMCFPLNKVALMSEMDYSLLGILMRKHFSFFFVWSLVPHWQKEEPQTGLHHHLAGRRSALFCHLPHLQYWWIWINHSYLFTDTVKWAEYLDFESFIWTNQM